MNRLTLLIALLIMTSSALVAARSLAETRVRAFSAVTPTAARTSTPVTPGTAVVPTATSPVGPPSTPAVTPTAGSVPTATSTSIARHNNNFWHTSGSTILDAQGRTVRIAAITWYGMESSYWVPAGLDYQPYTAIMDRVKVDGFNTIRLPFSNEMVERNPIITDKVAANPEFLGEHALDMMDAIVVYAQKIGLKIILDDHRSEASRPRNVNVLDDTLWYTPTYPETAWIHDWVTLAWRYRADDAVVGFDLRNEPHTDARTWNLNAYLHNGSTWGPYAGVDNPATDWRLAAERVGNAVLAVNPHLLIIVEGLQLYPDPAQPQGVDSYWWGSILSPAARYPVVLTVPHQLVYSAHDWGPWKWNMKWFRNMSYQSLLAVWERYWAFVLSGPNPTPLWIGEFGTCTNNPGCVDVVQPDNQAQWFHYLLRFLQQNPQVGWGFFALNGTNSNDSTANNGFLNGHWTGPANTALWHDLQTIMPARTP